MYSTGNVCFWIEQGNFKEAGQRQLQAERLHLQLEEIKKLLKDKKWACLRRRRETGA